MGKRRRVIALGATLLAVGVVGIVAAACGGDDAILLQTGEAGATGPQGPAGEAGVVVYADSGTPVADGGAAQAQYNPALDLAVTVSNATVSASNVLTVELQLTDRNGVPVVVPITSDGRIGTLAENADGGAALYTPDQVGMSFSVAWLDPTSLYYTSYCTVSVPSAAVDSGSVVLALFDGDTANAGNARFATSPKGAGWYTYTFGTPVAPGVNATNTHTVAAVATRTVPAAAGVAAQHYSANAAYDWLPAGGTVTTIRDVVRVDSCNQCHGALGHHGPVDNMITDTRICVLCHSASTSDSATGLTTNFGTMVHKIHAGTALPSNTEVDGGVPVNPYTVGGTNFSGIVYPKSTGEFLSLEPHSAPTGSNIGDCAKCHANATTWAGAKGVMGTPSQEKCTSCHDRTYFDPTPPTTPASSVWAPHYGGTLNVTGCQLCHGPGQNNDPVQYHNVVSTTVVATINSARMLSTFDGGGPELEVNFSLTVNDKNNAVVNAVGQSALAALGKKGTISIVVGGPVPDFKFGHNKSNSYLVYKGSTASGSPNGTYSVGADNSVTWVSSNTGGTADLSTITSGTWAVAITGGAQRDPSDPIEQGDSVVAGSAKPGYKIVNPLYYFDAVSGNAASAPADIVTATNCDSCHGNSTAGLPSVPGHGGSRNVPGICRLCHQPSQQDDDTPSNLMDGGTVLSPTADLKAMIHQLHLGTARNPGAAATEYYGDTFTTTDPVYYGDFNAATTVTYPDKLNDCQRCHAPGTSELPLADDTQQASESQLMSNANGVVTAGAIQYQSPTAAACTGCHVTTAARAHADLMTVNAGASAAQSPANPTGFAESCAACHGTNAAYDVALVHKVVY